ncbi:PqqD family protein [Microbacterium sp. ARD31]|uniref:PqqD family protein n=1 Tax=Microbacterium sp. ARD31 TaxID=2962576 RepID=UPI0028825759|nr:PqqD family protein [Microbacterium sp. ARD31]MDT0186465.1 PqqD family protein [Microbacterium sp. ARD31]
MASSLRAAPHVAEQWSGATLYLARLPAGPIHVLDPVGGLIWSEVTTGHGGDLLNRLAARLGVEPQEIAPAVFAFIDELVARELLVQAPMSDELEY